MAGTRAKMAEKTPAIEGNRSGMILYIAKNPMKIS